ATLSFDTEKTKGSTIVGDERDAVSYPGGTFAGETRFIDFSEGSFGEVTHPDAILLAALIAEPGLLAGHAGEGDVVAIGCIRELAAVFERKVLRPAAMLRNEKGRQGRARGRYGEEGDWRAVRRPGERDGGKRIPVGNAARRTATAGNDIDFNGSFESSSEGDLRAIGGEPRHE